ncbi:MAG: hypothetical protein PHO74_06205 [Weeksellaceae bacterium]|nr:hypothetical protein [Weeksellaceae bacterium]
MKNYLLILLFNFLIQSCISIGGLTNDYNKLSEEHKSLITPLKSFEELENGKIYPIHSQTLKNELKKHPKAIVYVFTNWCSSEFCLPMNVYINYAEKQDSKLFLVMNSYGGIDVTLSQMAETPYFVIDNSYYNSNIRGKYTRYFENELMGLPKETKHKDYPGNLFFFEKGVFKNVYKNLP